MTIRARRYACGSGLLHRSALCRAAALAGICLFVSVPQARAQQSVVLSGGGARGLAHIGVLIVLDSLGYDPDIVIGNSMGAVVGALYAAGLTPEEIRERTAAVNWGEMFDPTPVLVGPAREVRLPMLSFSLDPARRRISRGVFGEWRINRTLTRLLFDAGARARGDFDRLPRRFRAVTADLQSGEKVVLAKGDLSRAVRASMAYPGFFAPVPWAERILVDGGIADNLPTIEARRLAASHVIAVDVSTPTDELRSTDPLVLAQRALSLMQANMHPDPTPPDITVRPVSEGAFAGPAFPDDPNPLVELGIEAARASVPPAVPASRRSRTRPAPPAALTALRVEADDPARARLVQRVFASVAPGPYDEAAVLHALDRLYSTGLFDGVWPRVETAADGTATLIVHVQEPPRLSLSLAGGFDNDRGGRAWASLDRFVNLAGRPGSVVAAASTTGLQRTATLSTSVHALGRTNLTLTAGAHILETSVRTFFDDTRVTTEVLRSGGWIALELPHLLRERVVSLIGRVEHVDPEVLDGGGAHGVVVRLAGTEIGARVVGAPLLLEAEQRWGTFGYRRLAWSASLVGVSGPLQRAAIIDVRAVSDAAPFDVQPALGDDRLMPGLRWGELRGRATAVVGADLAAPAPLGGFARLRVRLGGVSAEATEWSHAQWHAGADLGGLWRIPLGTLEAGFGYGTFGDGRFSVSIGRTF